MSDNDRLDSLRSLLFNAPPKPEPLRDLRLLLGLAPKVEPPSNLASAFLGINTATPRVEPPTVSLASLAGRPRSGENPWSVLSPNTVLGKRFSHASLPPPPTPPTKQVLAGTVLSVQLLVNSLLKKKADVSNGRVLPDIGDLAVMEGRRVRAAFVYSDLHGFTKLVASQPTNRSFQFLHSFVYVTTLLTKHYGGQVMDCAGDRVLSVFHRPPYDLSSEPVEDAITFALWLQTVFTKAIAPTFTSAGFEGLSVGIGIDYGETVVGCVGIRNDKRIVFFGDAANKAAKLQEIAGPGETVLSGEAATRRPSYLDGDTWTPRSEMQNGEFVQRFSQIFSADQAPKVR